MCTGQTLSGDAAGPGPWRIVAVPVPAARLEPLWRRGQTAAYSLLQQHELRRLRGGATTYDGGEGAPYLTVVTRLPASLAESIHASVMALPAVDTHYVYPATDMHMTILNLDGSRATSERDRVRAATHVLATTARFSLSLQGFGLSRSSVYAEVYDESRALWALRSRLASATSCAVPLPKRLLGFVNVVRFRSTEVSALVRAVRARNRHPIGRLDVSCAEVVRTEKLLSQRATTLLARIEL